MRIRPATLEDAPVLWKSEVETATVPGRLVSRPHELQLAAFESKIKELEEGGCYVVAEDGDVVCGHAFVDPMSMEAIRHVYRLTVVVHPGHTGQGVGGALLAHLQGWATSRPEVHKIELMVRSTNTGAIRLYERLGFVEEGRLRDRIRLPSGEYIDDVSMAWFPRAERVRT